MTDLSTVQSGVDRKTVCDNGATQQSAQSYLDALEVEKQIAYATHFSNVIGSWCNQTDPLAQDATQSTLDLPINALVDSAILGGWETDLTGKGYTVTRDGNSFKVQLPA